MKIPKHLAVIMDGNGRWARERGLPRIAGHYEGVKRGEELVDACIELGIRWLTLFTFSTENWKRPELEVKALMKLLEGYLRERSHLLLEKGIRVSFIGRRDRLPKGLSMEMERVEKLRPSEEKIHVILAIDYGGRDEILRTFKKISEASLEPTEKNFKLLSDLPEVPDPDLLIRTGGEKRISNFLLWHLAYTELYFTDTYWPDFRKEELIKALEDFSRRERRFGAVLKE
ncbi:polyprenyl diphosphate synthase [Pampinifervens florentissimum]|uniref:polyprenyl diphosphate synthase n=1 Tax=Pampinifervens florentissimum TaxID=1632019 RepID=UPI0013B4819E|nr:polyprenyl diphosphate synthase [Hydrogenobacter sp. T-8]QID32432.1 di-trans,poly-cis-decaprenylcistransferase [Hydrogenobacter sp. T-8]